MRQFQALLRISWLCSLVSTMAAVLPATATAQEKYPTRSIEVVTQYPPGGIADTSIRAIQPFLSKRLGVTLVIVNKPGAGGIIATEYVKHAAADGYTVLNGADTPFTTARATNSKIPYSISDFVALGLYAVDPTVIISRANSPWKNFAELVRYAKANPGKLNYGDGGLGGGGFFTMEIVKQARDLTIQSVHFKGSAPLATQVLGGHIDLASGGRGALAPLVTGGLAIGLATTANERLPEMPDVPTLSELGIPDAAISPSMALFVPKATPANIIKTLSEALADVMRDPQAIAALKRAGIVPEYHDGATTTRMYEAEFANSRKIAEQLNLIQN